MWINSRRFSTPSGLGWKRRHLVSVFLGCLLIVSLATEGFGGLPIKFLGFKVTGSLNLTSGDRQNERTLTIYRNKKVEERYIIKIRRNTLDSRFMTEDSIVSGWIDIPIPLPFINDIRKKHTIRYWKSDADWDYFKLELEK